MKTPEKQESQAQASQSQSTKLFQSSTKVAIIGGGVAGTTVALRLAELGIDTTLIEQGDSLVNGPPFCHLHAGGNFYREISDQQCITLLKQSIDCAKVYPLAINHRPTVVALPKTDQAEPEDLLPRLEKVRASYAQLVAEDKGNKVLGEPENYFELFSKAQLLALRQLPLPKVANKSSDWLVAFAQQVDLSTLKFPVVLVQEYGWSAFRVGAIAELAAQRLPHCLVKTHTKVSAITATNGKANWRLTLENQQTMTTETFDADYVVNACGFKSGEIDDLVGAKRQRLVEFKAAYLSQWSSEGLWPEVIFHGERGTPQGMAQLTPYAEGYFQLHGMTKDITLFEQGIACSDQQSAQPKLAPSFINKIEQGWPEPIVKQRTQGAINYLAQFIPEFAQAQVAGKPMFGAQQVPGDDVGLRAAEASFSEHYYARTEIVKASSALTAADSILQHLVSLGLVAAEQVGEKLVQHYFPVTLACHEQEVTDRAKALAAQRHYPTGLAVNL